MKNVSHRNGTKAISISTYIIKPQPSISTNRDRLTKNINRNGTKATPTSTYSNNFIKSLPSFSTNQHRFMKNVKNIHNGTKATSTLAHINDDIAVNNSNNVNKLLLSTHKKKLVPLVAYGIYRPVSYYDLSEWTFRILNGYDDGYLIQIFEDCDYVIFTKIVKVNKPENFVVSPPPKANECENYVGRSFDLTVLFCNAISVATGALAVRPQSMREQIMKPHAGAEAV
ncbi:unnamed protein product [Brugia pahangi]|uniref:START domain-containing protein n=1 Tax=Brugia pahangi TaxID=6280 RepID=A0A0N4TR90_BRUPA|nr:unnamed protein product [Brugia pahangi]